MKESELDAVKRENRLLKHRNSHLEQKIADIILAESTVLATFDRAVEECVDPVVYERIRARISELNKEQVKKDEIITN